MSRKLIIAVITLCLLSATVARADPFDGLVRSGPVADGAGAALLVMRNGEVVKEQGYGYANIEQHVPVTPDTYFELDSVTKMFTAAGVLLLAQEGKLKLDDPVAKYFPGAPVVWNRITIRQLLTHTSGLRDSDPDGRKDCSGSEWLALLQQQPIEFEPGAQWSYSNTGYDILGFLITKVTAEPWSGFLAGRLFEPLGMHTVLNGQRGISSHRAAGYVFDPRTRQLVNQEQGRCPDWNFASGGLLASLRDLAIWHKALDARSFMSEENFAAWWTAARLSSGARHAYGFGWFLAEQRGEPVVYHTGHSGGFSVEIARYPQQHLAIAYLTNVASVNVEAVVREVAGLADQRLKLPEVTRQDAAADKRLSSSMRAVLEAWAAHRTTEAMSPPLGETATGSDRESFDRKSVGRQLQSAHALRVIGTDQLSAGAESLLADGSVSSADAVLETDGGPVRLHFRLDAEDRVVSFTHY